MARAEEWNLRDHIPLRKAVVQSHRGAGVLMPENSIEFLRKAGNELRAQRILFQTLPWQSPDPELFWKLMDLGAASFASDYPDVTMKAIRDYFARAGGKK